MISFKQHLVEKEFRQSREYYVDLIEKHCGPLLREVGGIEYLKGYAVWRGMRPKDDAFVTVRKDRKPLNSSSYEHRVMVKFFKENFGINHREESIMATGNYEVAKGYGNLHAIFPVGDFQFAYSPEREGADLTYMLRVRAEEAAFELADMDDVDTYDDEVFESWKKRNAIRIGMLALHGADFTDKNFKKGIESGSELMIHCDKYIAVPESVWNET